MDRQDARPQGDVMATIMAMLRAARLDGRIDAQVLHDLHTAVNRADWRAALITADVYELPELVRYLCHLPAEYQVHPTSGLVSSAASRGDRSTVRWLCELPLERGVDLSAKGKHALIMAVMEGHAEVVRYLCQLPSERGIDPAMHNDRPLRRAVSCRRPEVVRVLCELPADRGVNAAACGNEPLRMASKWGYAAIVRYLCELPAARGVDPAAYDNLAVRLAAAKGHAEVVRYLCELPAARGTVVDPAACGNEAVRLAAAKGHAEVVRYLCQLPVGRGVDPAADDNEAVRLAAAEGHTEVVRYLCQLPVERRVDPAARRNEAVRLAAAKGHVAVVQLLCQLPQERRVCPGGRFNEALEWAAAGGHLSTVAVLCQLPQERQVDPAACDNAPLRRAAANGHVAVVAYLHGLPQVLRYVPRGGDRRVLEAAWCSKWPLAAVGALLRHHVEVYADAHGTLAGHIQRLLLPAMSHAASRMGPTEMHRVHLACTLVLGLDTPTTGFRNFVQAMPLLTRTLVTAGGASNEIAACAALRVASCVIDATNVWSRAARGGDRSQAASRRRVALKGLVAAVAAAVHSPARFASFGKHTRQRLWRLLGDVVHLAVPTAQCLDAGDRSDLVMSVGRSLRAVPGWCPERGSIMAWLRASRGRVMLQMRLLRDQGRATPVVAHSTTGVVGSRRPMPSGRSRGTKRWRRQ